MLIHGHEISPCTPPRSERAVFKLIAYTFHHPVQYPHPVERRVLGYFSTLDSAEGFMRSRLRFDDDPQDPEQDTVLHLEIEAIELDVPRLVGATHIYDGEARPVATERFGERRAFAGREPEACRFRVGELVQFLQQERLHVGIVSALPLTPKQVERLNARCRENPLRSLPDAEGVTWPIVLMADQSDDTYTVLYGWEDSGEAELPEYALARPVAAVGARYRQRLGERRRYEHGFHTALRTDVTGLPYGIGLNDYRLDTFPEPHAVVYGEATHLIISLSTYRLLEGDSDAFEAEGFIEVLGFIREHAKQLIEAFEAMRRARLGKDTP